MRGEWSLTLPGESLELCSCMYLEFSMTELQEEKSPQLCLFPWPHLEFLLSSGPIKSRTVEKSEDG